MKVVIVGRHANVSQKLREYIEEKFQRLNSYIHVWILSMLR